MKKIRIKKRQRKGPINDWPLSTDQVQAQWLEDLWYHKLQAPKHLLSTTAPIAQFV